MAASMVVRSVEMMATKWAATKVAVTVAKWVDAMAGLMVVLKVEQLAVEKDFYLAVSSAVWKAA